MTRAKEFSDTRLELVVGLQLSVSASTSGSVPTALRYVDAALGLRQGHGAGSRVC